MEQSHPYHRDATVFFLLVALFVGGAIVLFLTLALRLERSITSYDECKRSATSKILESYPEICVSAGGKRFVNPHAEQIVPPVEPSPTPVPITFSLPAGWKEVDPDLFVQPEDEKVSVREFMRVSEDRPYPIGRITLQYTDQDILDLPKAVFAPTQKQINGINYQILESEESLEGVSFSSDIYLGTPRSRLYVRIFSRYQNATEQSEQESVLSTFQVSP